MQIIGGTPVRRNRDPNCDQECQADKSKAEREALIPGKKKKKEWKDTNLWRLILWILTNWRKKIGVVLNKVIKYRKTKIETFWIVSIYIDEIKPN